MSVGEQIDLDALWRDPWPIYKALREHEPVSWVPEAGRYFVTRYDDITALENDPETFSAEEKDSLIYRVMGHPFMRRDGLAHSTERGMLASPLTPKTVKTVWRPIFEKNTTSLISALVERGNSAELTQDFCGPLAARNLAYLLGFLTVDEAQSSDAFDEPLQRWSLDMMDAVGNYKDDPDVWSRADESVKELDEDIARTITRVQRRPDESIISAAVNNGMSLPSLYAAVKVIIGGGINEPKDALGVATYALLKDDELRQKVLAGPDLWRRVFEEAIRWVAPISMYPKMVTKETVLGGVVLHPGDRIAVCVGSGNRDERVFSRPDEFDIDRAATPHHAFGGGAHFCAGAWVARMSVGNIALPQLFGSFPKLRLAPNASPQEVGWVFRGLMNLDVTWA